MKIFLSSTILDLRDLRDALVQGLETDINVGLIERKERPKMKEVEDAAQGSQIYHPVEYIILLELLDLLVGIDIFEPIDFNHYICSYVANTFADICLGDERIIAILTARLERSASIDRYCLFILRILEKIGINNQQAIDNLVKLLEQDDLDNSLRCHVARALGTIDTGNRQAIDNLVKLLKMDGLENPIFYSIVIEALETIGTDNQQVIDIITKLLEPIELLSFEHSLDRVQVIKTLGKIGIGNEQTIFCLIALLKQDNLEDVHYINVVEALEKMVVKQKMPSVIRQLRNYVTDEIYKSNFPQFQSCYQILFQCAQTLSYPEFQIAWHQTHRR